jgi:exopolysaccharide biosynthesis protein
MVSTRKIPPFLILQACTLFWLFACSGENSSSSKIPMNWKPINSLNANLPRGIKLFAGRNDSLPINAWYVAIDEKDSDIYTKVFVSDDSSDNRETVSSFAKDLGARVVVNGGYFTMNVTPAHHYGLLISGGEVISNATDSVIRDSVHYDIARAAIGFSNEGDIDISWVTTRDHIAYAWPLPPRNRPGKPAEPLDYSDAQIWKMHDAIGAGPALIMNGRIHITSDEEVFFGTVIPKIHPRTAAGYTKKDILILMVVDGRQEQSRGVSLDELAILMQELNVIEAMNLDGGGSTSLVVDNTLVNHPTSSMAEREVMSVIATFTK